MFAAKCDIASIAFSDAHFASFVGFLPSPECNKVSPWRRQSLQLQAECMRAAKAQRTASVQETVGSSIETPAEESLPGPSEPNESVLLPAPDTDDDSSTDLENESSNDYGSDFTREDADDGHAVA